MAILPLAILAIGRVSAAAPARAQTYNLNYPVTCGPTASAATTWIAAIHRCLSATRRPRASRRNAWPIHILRARESPRVIDGIAALLKLTDRIFGSCPASRSNCRPRSPSGIRQFCLRCLSVDDPIRAEAFFDQLEPRRLPIPKRAMR
jgi:hypothetical protein